MSDEIEWWEYDTAAEMAEAVAGDVGFVVESALGARGQALLALPGGKSPIAAMERLAKAKIDWKRVTIIPGDDRLVPVNDPLSNVAALARIFLPKGARVLPIGSENVDYQMAGKAADARLQDLHWPPDLVWLGIGTDGHTASILPGPDMAAALDAPKARRAVGVMPDPLPPEAPVARVTLTKAAILSARVLMVTLSGTEKRRVLEEAIRAGASGKTAIGRVLADAEQAIDIHWSAS
ncbi:MAG: 6-phosphogluconolactonase [Sphingomonas fennica]